MSCDCECSTKAEEDEFTVCAACETTAACKEAQECKKGYGADASCPVGEEMVDGKCQAISVTVELDIDDVVAVVEAETGKTIIEIRGIAFHEGFNKNHWAISRDGVQNVVNQMIGSDLTLQHPEPDGHGFSRNMDGGVEEAVI